MNYLEFLTIKKLLKESKMKEMLLKVKEFILNSEVIYWLSRNIILALGLYFSISAILFIPKMVSYIHFVVAMEFIALALCGFAAHIYTNKKLENLNSNILGWIFLGVHFVVGIASTVIYSDLF